MSPCRIAVYLAADAAVGVVLRRGPSAWTQLIGWDRERDRFTPGQWLRARVYARRADLSPDGRLFVYIAARHGGPAADPAVGSAWTAISRPPWFTALALWPNLGSWYGGGVFRGPRSLSLDVPCSLAAQPRLPPRRLRIDRVGAATSPWEQRLLRDGWTLVERGFEPRNHRRVGDRELWSKPGPDGALLVREVLDADFRRHGDPFGELFWLEAAGELIPLDGVSWAEWDGPRLLVARDGRLLRAELTGGGLRESLLYDFNPLRPVAMPAPAWARRW